MPTDLAELVDHYEQGRLSRRRFFTRAATLGVSAAAAGALLDRASPAAAGPARAAGLGAGITATNVAYPPAARVPMPAVETPLTIFAAGHGYTAANVAASNLNDSSDAYLGTQSAWVRSLGNGGSARLQKLAMPAINMAGKVFVVYVKVPDVTHVSSLQFYAGHASLTNAFVWTFQGVAPATSQYAQPGVWTRVPLAWSYATTLGSPNRAAITDLSCRLFDDNTGNQVQVYWNGIATMPEPAAWPNGVCSITFDDQWSTAWTGARPTMDRYGFRGTIYTIADQVGQPGRCTLGQLQRLRDLDWDIGAHAATNANHNLGFPALSASALEAELQGIKQWGVDNGFRSIDHLAYPLGSHDTGVRDLVKSYFASARTTFSKMETWPPGDVVKLRATSSIGSYPGGTTVGTAKALIDAAFANKTWLILVFHHIVPGAPAVATQCSQADFDTLMSYLASKGIPVRPVGQVLGT